TITPNVGVRTFNFQNFNLVITTRFLEIASTDNDLAVVIGHEFGHIDKWFKLIRAGIEPPSPFGPRPTDQEVLNRESSADGFGIEIAKKAGYEPQVVIPLFEKALKIWLDIDRKRII